MTAYADLPVQPGTPAESSWGLWGSDDRLGALNRLSPSRVLAALPFVRTGEVVSLALPVGAIDPPLFGRSAPRRRVTPLGPLGAAFDEVVEEWNLQSSSQWDGFGHVSEPGVGAYNGLSRSRHGMEHWARHGIVGRGLIVDLARDDRNPLEYGVITAAELAGALAALAEQPQPGDILLVRTGWLARYRGLHQSGREALAAGSGSSLGLAAEAEVSALLWDLGFAAVAADNPSLEAWPPPTIAAPGRPTSLHRSLLCRLGLPIGELWDLDTLATRCVERGCHAFLCVSAPLPFEGAVASPANAVAIL